MFLGKKSRLILKLHPSPPSYKIRAHLEGILIFILNRNSVEKLRNEILSLRNNNKKSGKGNSYANANE